MLRESVIQYPTLAASDGQNRAQKGASPCCSFAEVANTLAMPPPAEIPQTSRTRLPIRSRGAANDSKSLTPSTPRRIITSCIAQNTKNIMKECPGTLPHPLKAALIRASRARPPIQVCIPNQTHATSDRAIAAKLAPLTPKEALTKTGKGMPYLVPA